MPARRQVALGAALVVLLTASVALAAMPDPTIQSAAVVTTTTDPPSTPPPTEEAKVIRPPTTTTTLPPTTTTAPPPPPTVVARSASEPVPATGDRFDALAQCESGGDPTTNTGNGYYGAFQFDLQTWQSVGRTGYPHEHSYGEQKAAAIDLHAQRGWHPWPACARKLGYL